MRKWLIRTAIAVGLLAFAAAVWFAGPLVGYEDIRPFDPVWVRLLIIFVVFAAVGGFYGVRWWLRRRAAKALEAALAESEGRQGDGKVLGERMAEALETLKRASGKRNYLYDLPWYVIVGPPGAGKTTALVNSGLKFPLAGPDGGKAVAGTGGTRYCDWWFTEEAVLIDTAGRYTTQDSDSETDKKSWLSFLSLLKQQRAKQPINGVILAISIEDLLKLDGQQLGEHATAIRKRLLELHQQLKIDFPVYALFTKADLIAGFAEYFGSFTEARRRKVWGATFQTEDRRKNMVGEVPAEFDLLVRRLTEEVTDRLHEEPDPIARIAIFGFPAQFALLKERVADFLNRIFEPTRYQADANLRGFYFSSGTQEGTPIDQVLGSIGRSFGETAHASQLSGQGKSFFLRDLLTKVIFAEAGWVSRDMGAVRRAALLRYGALAAMGLVAAGALGAWGMSFASNRQLIAATDSSAEQYRVNAAPELKTNTVADVELSNAAGLLDILRTMPVGYDNRDLPTPMRESFGLAQRPRLVSAAGTTYRQALERMFRSRLILRLERQIEASMNDPLALYETLKVYLMLGGQAPKVDEDLVETWMRKDWEENLYPGPNNRALREDLVRHLGAMLDLGSSHKPSFELNGPLVESAQRSLARMNMADRAYALIKTASYSAPVENFSVIARGGPDTALVFETVDGTELDKLAVPGLYTYAGFQDFFIPQLAAVADKIEGEKWVMGELAEQKGVEEQFGQLGPVLIERYGKDFVDAWNAVIDNLKLKSMSADKPQYLALSAASSPNSPIRQLFEAVSLETQLTREPVEGELTLDLPANLPDIGGDAADAARTVAKYAADRAAARASGLARIGIDLAMKKFDSRAGDTFSGSAGARPVPGANIEAQFRPFHELVKGDPGKRPVDALVQNFYEVYQSLVLAATNPSQAARANANMQMQVVNLRANASRLPRPVARMVNAAVDDFEGDAAGNSLAQLNQMLNSEVTQACDSVIANRYPFAKDSERDVRMQDFARIFAPNGVIDRFFAQNLAPLTDMGGGDWVWKEDTRLGRELSKATLKEFQRAAEIRDAFFPQTGPMPAVSLTVTPFSLNGEAEMALFRIDGQLVQSTQVGGLPLSVQWPSSMSGGTASVELTPDIPGRASGVVTEGDWALMRLFEYGSVSQTPDGMRARFVIGGRDVAYSIRVGSVANPFFLPALTQFSCPSGL
ncbi:type VI secretion system membrane subunit TssM [Kumtagia ephedrae]|jgi:type VI secretion system protein ImpL|uniref:Type VI secretion system membrane subunit TssM n=1 Tax=Kumtagia ephedrae TaxID=2116701 RepID=A0A2P7S3G5_9HYPH|nr:type VI secretion system membrane subunit TssM [Mesorhizobium ephedrae]PSJ57017.1 type VI secretion system membrane subunit TssM [Mesorhizobium ephedrae]